MYHEHDIQEAQNLAFALINSAEEQRKFEGACGTFTAKLTPMELLLISLRRDCDAEGQFRIIGHIGNEHDAHPKEKSCRVINLSEYRPQNLR